MGRSSSLRAQEVRRSVCPCPLPEVLPINHLSLSDPAESTIHIRLVCLLEKVNTESDHGNTLAQE